MKIKIWARLIFLVGFFIAIVVGQPSCVPVPQAGLTVPDLTPALDSPKPAISTLSHETNQRVAAFPGAQGFGDLSVGGRGGHLIEVTNLNDSGPGSLRFAIEANGPRIVVFRVAGTIALKTSLVISKPFVTVAGQTAPGDGITLRSVSSDVEALIQIETHDVIVRYLTLRAGPPSAGDAMQILASKSHDTYNIVIDHNSMSWAVDRNLSTWYDIHDITIQWNIFSESLNCSIHPKGCHSKGVLLGGYASDENKDKPGAHNISFHHNLMAHNGERNPYIEAAGVVDVVNNIVYNPFGTFSHIDMIDQLAPDFVNYVGNYFEPGPDTEVKYGIKALNPGTPGAGIFVQGNIGPQRDNDTFPEINIVDPESRQFVVNKPFSAESIAMTTAAKAYNQVLSVAGATQGLNCDGTFFSRRDPIDTRIVEDVKNGTGKIIDDPSQVGGWLTISEAAPCADSDHDGMPDVWEQKYEFDFKDPSDATKDFNRNGYTNIEEFMNGTNPVQ